MQELIVPQIYLCFFSVLDHIEYLKEKRVTVTGMAMDSTTGTNSEGRELCCFTADVKGAGVPLLYGFSYSNKKGGIDMTTLLEPLKAPINKGFHTTFFHTTFFHMGKDFAKIGVDCVWHQVTIRICIQSLR